MLERTGSSVNQEAETELWWMLSDGPGTGLRKPRPPQVTSKSNLHYSSLTKVYSGNIYIAPASITMTLYNVVFNTQTPKTHKISGAGLKHCCSHKP